MSAARQSRPGDAPPVGDGGDGTGPTRVLAVGETWSGADGPPRLPHGAQVAFAEIHEVTVERLAEIAPDIVVTPLLSRSFDCLDLAKRLLATGFRGRLTIVAPALPRPELIRREVMAACPGLTVELVGMADLPDGPAK